MAEKQPQGCVEPAEGPIAPKPEPGQSDSGSADQAKGEMKMAVTVGKEAPDFGATAFHEGGFKSFKLSDFRDKWVLLCFYPGDFTFV